MSVNDIAGDRSMGLPLSLVSACQGIVGKKGNSTVRELPDEFQYAAEVAGEEIKDMLSLDERQTAIKAAMSVAAKEYRNKNKEHFDWTGNDAIEFERLVNKGER